MGGGPAHDSDFLVSRAADDVLFRTGREAITAAAFLASAHALADRLPAAGHVANLCDDRHLFALVFAAALLRRQVMLLTGDRTPARLAHLRRDHPGMHVLDDAAVGARLAGAPAAEGGFEMLNRRLPAGQTAALVFTSGSTGAPVGHAKSFGALVARARAMQDLLAPGEGPAEIVGTVPPQHMYGFETTIAFPLHAPAAVSCDPAFYHADIAAALGRAPGRRILVTTPMQLRLLLAGAPSLPPLQRVISATAPLPPELARTVETTWGVELHEIYGATEAGSVARRRTLDGDGWRCFPGVALRRAGGAVEVTAQCTAPTPLSDCLELGADGFRLLGRTADLVKLAGKRASLAGLTRILTGLDGVQDGVFIAPDDLEQRPSARLLAYVVAPDRTAADLLAELRLKVEPAFLPRRIVCVEGLPRNALGKLPRQALDALRERIG